MPNKPPRYTPTAARPAEHRPGAAARGYDHAWERFRLQVLGDVDGSTFPEGGPVCRDCEAAGRVTQAAHVDHKTPFRGLDDPLRFDPLNMRSLCHSCHSKKTARFDR